MSPVPVLLAILYLLRTGLASVLPPPPGPPPSPTEAYPDVDPYPWGSGLGVEVDPGPLPPRHSSPGDRAPSLPEDHDNTTYEPAEDDVLPVDPKQARWAEAAYRYLSSLDCKDVFFTTDKECRKLLRIPQRQITVHLAGPSPYGPLKAVLPSGGLGRTGSHDAVVVLDPYPHANYGHLVLVFYVELGVSQAWCTVEGGTYLEAGECLILALNRRCRNALERRKGRRNFARRCEVNFLPLVYLESDDYEDDAGLSRERRQRLICRSNVPGFGPCPALRTINETSGLYCNPTRENTKRCETTHETIKTRCRVFEICDQAVLLSGGWNRWTHRPSHKQNVWDFYGMLREHGFRRDNIQVFFGNGASGIEHKDEPVHPVQPAALKLAMRYHLQRLCLSPHCVDSLVVYLNNPARSDGTSLLWDADRDGVYSESETYSLAELLTDLADCEARQVHLIVDQSYSGEIVRAFRRSHRHRNVMVLASGRDNQYSFGREFTQFWTQSNHTQRCMKEVFREARKSLQQSSPVYHRGEDTSNVNIFGAPCDVIPPFTHRELRENYLGCQNLPTALWVMKFLQTPDRRAPRVTGWEKIEDFFESDHPSDDVDDTDRPSKSRTVSSQARPLGKHHGDTESLLLRQTGSESLPDV